MDEYYRVVNALPMPYSEELAKLDPTAACKVQEIRFRIGQPVQFTVEGKLKESSRYLGRSQHLDSITAPDLQHCFLQLCRYSVYAYEEELKRGFLTISGGHRVGVAGVWGGNGFSSVTSLNVRVARWILCPLPDYVQAYLQNPTGGLLVAGPPGCGKTTFLRTLVQYLGCRKEVVCVVDERGELMAGKNDRRLQGEEIRCDVYTRCPKVEAIHMALRCMNPSWIVCDELGTQADAQAVEQVGVSGVYFLASVHCDGYESLEKNPRFAGLLHTQAFSHVAFLSGRAAPGTVCKWMKLP